MAASKFHRNAIYTGYIDSYCLVCESHLRSEDDINIHIAKPIHSKNLDATSYLEKSKDDCIRKVKKGYFCEFCNLLLSTATKVGLHVAEAKHIDHKGTQLLESVGNNIVAFGDIVIGEKAWNGLIDDTCAICNTEFTNESIHKTESTHILNLVQVKVEFGAENSIYRKIDDSYFQCLTCNLILATNCLTTHFIQEDHKELVSQCRLEAQTDAEKNNTEQESKELKLPANKPTKPRASKNPTFDFEEETAKSVGAKDYMRFYMWCVTCDRAIDCPSPSSCSHESHLNGRDHQTMLKMHKERLKAKSEQIKQETLKKEDKIKAEEPKENSEKQENTSKILDSVPKFQKNYININFLSGTAVCKKCSKDVDFKFESIEAHIEEHKTGAPKKDAPKPFNVALKKDESMKNTLFSSPVKKRKDSVESRASSSASKDMDEEAETFAKANDFIICRADNKVYCRICDIKIPSALKNMKEHVTDSSHKNRAAKVFEFKNTLKPAEKVPLRSFLRRHELVKLNPFVFFIVNDKYCMKVHSFAIMKAQGDRLRCQMCEVNLTNDKVDEHLNSKKHEKFMDELLVLTSYKSEFIREIPPGRFHCGFCNLVQPCIEDLENHLKSTTHQEEKIAANLRLQQCRAEIAQNRAREEID